MPTIGPINSENSCIAKTILAQLGGHRFCTMTGAKDFLIINKGLQLHFPGRFTHGNIDTLRVTLNDQDLYDLEFIKRGNKRNGFDSKVVETVKDVYAENLQQIFTRVTGLDTHL
jgi:hypothetical protein